MLIDKDKPISDGIFFSSSKVIPKHYIKYSIRKHSLFKTVKIKLIVIYFIQYECFLINSSTKYT